MSSQIRRQIGALRKHLNRAIAHCEEDLQADLNDFIATCSNDSLLDYVEAQHTHREAILSKLTKLEQLNQEWSSLMTQHHEEIQTFHKFIEKYGDYRNDISKGIAVLEKLDFNEVILREAMEKKGIKYETEFLPKPSKQHSTVHSDDGTLTDNRIHHNLHNLAQRNVPDQQNLISLSRPSTDFHGDTNFNYFDASLLSRLDLPSFSGNLIEFPEFWSRFNTLVHSKSSLTGATKFSLLKSCLRGRALQCVDGLPITDHDYEHAIDILHLTYDNPSTIRHIIYTQLSALPQCDSEGKQLQDLYLRMLRLVRQYSAITPNSPEYGLGALLYNKLPRFVKAKIYDKIGNQKNVTPNELMALLSDIVKKETTLRQVEQTFNSSHSTIYVSERRGPTALPRQLSHAPNATVSHHPSCAFCSKTNHNVFQCRTFATAEERRNRTRQIKLCFKCLRPDHKTTSCRRPPCQFCNYHHHPALCFKTRNKRNNPHRNEHTENRPVHRNPTATNKAPTERIASNEEKRRISRPSSHQFRDDQHKDQIPSHSRQINFSDTAGHESKIDTNKDNEANQPTDITYSALADSTPNNSTQKSSNPHPGSIDEVLLMCTSVTLVNPEDPCKQINTIAFLDSGSSHSYITSKVAEQLQLNHSNDGDIILHTFASSQPTMMASKMHSVSILLPDETLYSLQVQSLPLLTKALMVPYNLHSALVELQEHGFIPTAPTDTGILIGMDHFWQLVLSSQFYSTKLSNGYYLLNTRLGKIIAGKKISTRTINMAVRDDHDHPLNKETLDDMVQRFWTCESLGTTDEADSRDDLLCLNFFNRTTRYDEEEHRYYTRLPFKSEPPPVPENYAYSLACLRSNWKTLSKNPDHLERYNNIIRDQLQRGIISEASPTTIRAPGTYLSHHAVINLSKKTTKIRLVYNGSAKSNNSKSLNDCLFRGPTLLPDLSGILIRARLANFLLIGDIEKAYHMVGLEECDRRFTKFLWLKNYKKPPTSDNLWTLNFVRVPFGLICSAFLLAATIHLHLTRAATPLAQEILTSCYVDNIFLTADTIEQAKKKYLQTKELFTLAGMNVREWISSNEELNATINQYENSPMDETTKLLGIQWRIKSDKLIIRLPVPDTKLLKPTKRNVLKKVASIFDPLGIISPVTVSAKIFLQSLWKESRQWDDILPTSLQQEWHHIVSTWTQPYIEIPRKILCHPPTSSSFQLHIFTDASQAAYCAVAYLRTTTESDTTVQLLMSRTRLSPLRSTITIPRLELSAVSLGAILMKHLIKELNLNINQQYIWSDSKAALQWVKAKGRLPIFIENRIKAITKNAPCAILRHVPSSSNPADIGSRGTSFTALKESDMWWNGPPFLRLDSEQWPKDISADKQPSEGSTNHTALKDEQQHRPYLLIVNTSKFSKWRRLLRVVITVLTFIFNVKYRIKNRHGIQLQIPDYNNIATMALFRQAQSSHPLPEDQKRNLHAYFDEEEKMWRSKGRISNSTLSFDTINPVILPRHEWITSLYILYIHEKNHHTGVAQTLTALRLRVWIPQGRTEVKRVINKFCMYCKREKANPFRLPPFPQHPPERVRQPRYPFYNCGIDYAGPFQAILNQDEVKVWIALFTCLNTRAIYVDVATSLSATCFLNLFRRFIASVGCPRWILCDNAPAFTSVAKLFTPSHPEVDQNLMDYCSEHNITFKFIPAFAPWQGGVYERMIKIFKTSFKAAIHNRKIDLNEFFTLAKECEAIVNCRPLTYVYNDIDSGYPLRPIDFLRPLALLGTPRTHNEQDADDEWKIETHADELQERWTFTLSLLNKFWKRWSKEYLTSMREQHQSEHPQSRLLSQETPQQDHIVIVHDSTKPRGQWKTARIISRSDHSATLQLPNKHVITRPLNLLYPLEIPASRNTNKEEITPTATSMDLETKDIASRNRRTHPMITRSIKRNALLSISGIAQILALLTVSADITSYTPPDTSCSSHHTIKNIIYADQCSSEGIAVARATTKENKQSLCWMKLTCPLGHIRIPIPQLPNTGYCGNPCTCPSWTTFCSSYNGRMAKTSTLKNIPYEIAHFIPSHVCSFAATEHCSKEMKIGVFYQIQLYDNTLIIVPELHIKTAEFLHKDDYYCFDKDGNEYQHHLTTQVTGTSAFCRRHYCIEVNKAKYFCTYTTPITTYELGNKSIIIQAWGTTTRQYYPHASFSSNESNLHFTIPRCATGGILIETTEKFNMIEVCSAHVCVYLSNYEPETTIFLPTSIVTFDYTTTVQAWTDGIRKFFTTLNCTGRPICEVLHCTVCWEHIYNYQCWTITQIITIIIASLLTLIFCRLLSPLFICLWWLAHKLCRTMKKAIIVIVYTITCRRRKYTIPQFPSYSKGIPERYTRTLSIALMAIHLCSACSDVVSITSTSHNCEINNTAETCTVDQVVSLHLQPIGQEACLLLRDSNDQPAGIISIRLHHVAYQCQQKTQYYTRDHRFHTESNHQCWNTKSCKGETCSGITTSSRIPELSQYANQRPGFTYCSPSCKCLWCDWCFRCTETCIFYRHYAEPSSANIYRIFNCPSWPITVQGTITTNIMQKKKHHNFILQPAMPHRWNHLQIALTATTSPNFPILSSFFISNGKKTAIVDPSPVNQLLPYSTGQLQCNSLKDAKDFNRCRYSPTTCHCSTSVYHAYCECPKGDMAAYLTNSSRILPLSSNNIIILNEHDNIIAKTSTGTSISVQISIDNMQIYTKRSRNMCVVKSGSLQGCHSCYTGATTEISCVSSLSEETAMIKCENQSQVAICKPEGHISKLTFHFQESHINANCSVKCPAGETFFALHGQLYYVSEPILQNEVSQGQHSRSEETGLLEFITSIKNTLVDKIFNIWTSLKNWSLIILIILALPIVISLFHLIRKRNSHQIVIKKKK